MQSDEARKWTDKQLSKMEDKIYKIYAEALESMQVKWDDFAKEIEPLLKHAKAEYDEAVKSGDASIKKKAEAVYQKLLKEQTIMNKYYKDMVSQSVSQLTNVNKTAVSYLNDKLPEIYAVNYNQIESDLKPFKTGYAFDLVDAQTVKNLATKDESLLPYKQIDKYKDEAWNRKIINSQILQGIVEGESISKIAKRLQNVVNADESSAIRNARTMTTSAECKGRMDSYRKAVDDGIILKKVWISKDDGRTRAWHLDLDGVEAEIDEPFVNEYGEIMSPGDPDADPCNVYNCRCSIKEKFLGFKNNKDKTIDKIEENSIIRKSDDTKTQNEEHYYEYKKTIDADNIREIVSELNEFEEKYNDSKIEHCIVLCENGEVYEVHGDKYTVNTDLLKDKMAGSINEHNHVTGESSYSFSYEDLRSSILDGSKIVIAFDELYRYVMKMPNKKIDIDYAYEIYSKNKDFVNNVLFSERNDESKTITMHNYQHTIIEKTCEELGIGYDRKRKNNK